MKAENFIELIEQNRFDKISKNGMTLIAERFRQLQNEQLAIQGVSCSASDVISKIKHLPESDFSEDGQLKLLRVCGNALGLHKAVKWMQKHYS